MHLSIYIILLIQIDSVLREGTMRRESSTFSTALFSLLIISFINQIQTRKLQQGCSSSCGDINIRSPFRLEGDPATCGDPDFELSCQSNKPILELHSGKYYVKKISYEESIINVIDVNLANGICNLPNKSLSVYDLIYYGVFLHGAPNTTYTNACFVTCSKNISNPAYTRVPCLSGNQSSVYVYYGGLWLDGLLESCSFISMVPVCFVNDKSPSYETIWKLLDSGFDLGWSVDCKGCRSSFNYCYRDTDNRFICSDSGGYFSFFILSIFKIFVSHLSDMSGKGLTFMSCALMQDPRCFNQSSRCFNQSSFFYYPVGLYNYLEDLSPSCSIYRRVDSSAPIFLGPSSTTPNIVLAWKTPDGCSHCEISGHYCGFNFTSKSTICCNPQNSTICPNIHHADSHGPTVTILVSTAASIGGIIFFALLILLIYKFRESANEKETQVKVEKFLEDYRTLNPTRYTYNDLKRITSKFRHRLGQGGYGSVFKGKLSNGVPVAIKMLEHSIRNGEEFINEVATIGRIHHFNIVRLLGFYSEGTRRALIYEFMPNGSLEKFIFSKTDKSTRLLSWEKLWEIAIGVARGIEYLHQGCNQRILHFDIKPHNILLDYNFQPKISDFGLAKLCSKEQSIVSMTAARGTARYIAPELFSRNFGEVSYESDVFSYGMMLLEMVGCRKNIDVKIENESQIFFPEWIYNKMSQGEELGFEVEADEDEEIAKKLAIVGLWCIQWNPTERPSTPMVIQMLEGDLQSLEMPPKPFVSSEGELGAN